MHAEIPEPAKADDDGRVRRSIVPILALLLLAACSSSPPTDSLSEASNQVVTLDNHGQTIALKTGETFLLKLGKEYDWTVTIADQTILSRVKNVMVVRGAQGLYEANKSGSTTLTATDDPVCLRSQPSCAVPSRLFKIKVEVQ